MFTVRCREARAARPSLAYANSRQARITYIHTYKITLTVIAYRRLLLRVVRGVARRRHSKPLHPRSVSVFLDDAHERKGRKGNRERSNALKDNNTDTRCEQSGTFARRHSRAYPPFADSKLPNATVRAGRTTRRCEPAPLDGAIAFHARQGWGIRAVTGEGRKM